MIKWTRNENGSLGIAGTVLLFKTEYMKTLDPKGSELPPWGILVFLPGFLRLSVARFDSEGEAIKTVEIALSKWLDNTGIRAALIDEIF